ncbi:hypothetical protein evm_011055, partial [Chilo suppressalis]
MATMVKEQRREKKKYKEKASKTVPSCESPPITNQAENIAEQKIPITVSDTSAASESMHESQTTTNFHTEDQIQIVQCVTKTSNKLPEHSSTAEDLTVDCSVKYDTTVITATADSQSIYSKCIGDLEKVNLSDISLASEAHECIEDNPVSQGVLETAAPSAPTLEEEVPHLIPPILIPVVNELIRLKSMPLQEAIGLFGGTVIAEVMAMSEKEEAIVEAGPASGPEHPLVDLLSTLRRSLIAVEREQTQLEIGYSDEEKFRSALWKVSKRSIQAVEKCPCGLNVNFRALFEHAELQKDKLPVARLRLERLLKDVQESYCHHQHEALLAHYQIEEFISEVVKSHKGEIREALTLVLQALKRCDNAPLVLAVALERWARALASALIDQRDLTQLLFLIHHLFRQTRSIRWAASIITVSLTDSISAAKAVALLDLLFARTTVDSAIECVEDREDAWEEVDKDGGGGAVSDGSLRERDLLALLRALPLRDLVATLLRLHPVVGQPRSYRWEGADGQGLIRACCGVRTLLHTLSRAMAAHARYSRLQRAQSEVARNVLHALAALDWQLDDPARNSYSPDLERKLLGELQAVFLSGLEVLSSEMHEVPASLLVSHAAREYCYGHMLAVEKHDECFSHRVESLSLDLPRASCDMRVRVVSHAALRRRNDYELARIVLEFLFQVGVRRGKVSIGCKGACRQAAQECMSALLTAHPYLHAFALHLVAETNPVEKLDAASIECLSISKWRPQSGEVIVVLNAWAQRCPMLLPTLLSLLDCTPHEGVSMESQLTIGTWLCDYVTSRIGDGDEWCWSTLRRLRLHRTYWALSMETGAPEGKPVHLFCQAYALAARSWGHSIPMICSEGVEALYALASARTQDALHFLSPIMLVLANSPESVSTTPRFRDLFTLLMNAGPGLMQRALGRGGAPGADHLLRLMTQQLKKEHCGGVSRGSVAAVWTAALWGVAGGEALLDAALLAAPVPYLLRHLTTLARAQDEESRQQFIAATKWYAHAPLLCESALCAFHMEFELRTHIFPRLLDALHAQRITNQRIHVDNALKSLGAGVTFSSDQLTIYGAAAATLASPVSHPSSLHLWRLLMHLYLQRPPSTAVDATPPVGPLFFSGLIKSRTLAQLKRRLLKFIQHHGNEAAALKAKQNKTNVQPQTVRSKSVTKSIDNKLTTPLSIHDLTGESNESSDSELSEENKEGSESDECVSEDSNVGLLLAYHVGAERMFCEYVRWLDEGEKTKAMPHDAEIARYIHEQASQAAFSQAARARSACISPEAEPPPLPPTTIPPPVPPSPTPLEEATRALLNIRDSSRKRSRRRSIRSPLVDVNIKDPRALLAAVDKHLSHMETLSRQWCTEVATVSSLDRALWDLVRGLRVPYHIPTLYASCSNKCKPIAYAPTEKQWCISTGAQQGIVENRSAARIAVRRLARSRPDAARSAAALLALARRSGSFEMARRMVERALQCAGAVREQCAPAAAALTSLVDLLADRWLLSSGSDCAALVKQWWIDDGSSVLSSVCVALVSPHRSNPQQVPALHAAVLSANVARARVFSTLSKFDLSKWSQSVDSNTRHGMLDSIMSAAQQWGAKPDPESLLLVELLGVQMAALCHATELCALVCACTRACVTATLPKVILQHVIQAAEKCAPDIPFDQLGHLLRELGVIWWGARTNAIPSYVERYDAYAHDSLELMIVLHRSFVDSAVHLSYASEKVGLLSWSSLQECMAAWALPPAPPSFPPALLHSKQYDNILKSVHRALDDLIQRHP